MSELSDDELDLAVAKALGWTFFRNKRGGITISMPGSKEYTEVGNYRPKFDSETGEPVPEITELEAFATRGSFYPSTDWNVGGPIIEREHIGLIYQKPGQWVAWPTPSDPSNQMTGPTPLIAAMRAFVASLPVSPV